MSQTKSNLPEHKCKLVGKYSDFTVSAVIANGANTYIFEHDGQQYTAKDLAKISGASEGIIRLRVKPKSCFNDLLKPVNPALQEAAKNRKNTSAINPNAWAMHLIHSLPTPSQLMAGGAV